MIDQPNLEYHSGRNMSIKKSFFVCLGESAANQAVIQISQPGKLFFGGVLIPLKSKGMRESVKREAKSDKRETRYERRDTLIL